MGDTRAPGQRAGLTRDAILRCARDVLSEQGIDGLTMRSVARRLGVAPNSLYSHVAGKDTLVDDLLDDVLGEVAEPRTTEPAAGLRQIMTSTYEVLLRHPDLVPLYLARQGSRGGNAQRLGEIMLDLLDAAGIAGPEAQEARRVLIVYTIGFAAMTTGSTSDAATSLLSRDVLAANFTTGLDWLLEGILATSDNQLPPHSL
ncbi:TetR/AcrR family transcriptional regulator [Actinobacteria bacterium YIM 96077]|uniref:HTH tetR-type domain-containing protein n=1 Tax=Phytoactinopolyspora halophila TaxID=1981511 RepID=A0A329QI65_9ACTN|nr:TetR/AcrR family transcriptional regulator [Phytoactinopolyspora halophila]AYY12393.1 TetR/AcrR family transcriptional regulator [Actinobacteria bacterium YIM 96077]RAW12030.1 hypothetical protein DPM12_15260 [Phytoactinopolyspora halophila]